PLTPSTRNPSALAISATMGSSGFAYGTTSDPAAYRNPAVSTASSVQEGAAPAPTRRLIATAPPVPRASTIQYAGLRSPKTPAGATVAVVTRVMAGGSNGPSMVFTVTPICAGRVQPATS